MALTFRKLEVFVAVAEHGNFRKAAERLGISQPSVSSQIKSMERYLGYRLFDRHRGATADLSVEGRDFLHRARELVVAQSALTSERRRAAPVPITLRAMIGPLLMERRVRPALARFPRTAPAHRSAVRALFPKHGRCGYRARRRGGHPAVHRAACLTRTTP